VGLQKLAGRCKEKVIIIGVMEARFGFLYPLGTDPVYEQTPPPSPRDLKCIDSSFKSETQFVYLGSHASNRHERCSDLSVKPQAALGNFLARDGITLRKTRQQASQNKATA